MHHVPDPAPVPPPAERRARFTGALRYGLVVAGVKIANRLDPAIGNFLWNRRR